MRFGKSKEEVDQLAPSGGGDFMSYLKDGDTTFRILQEPDDWTWYIEHFNPAGFSFPCTNEEDCPGCNSDIEKMAKRTRKVAFNVLQGFQGQDYVKVYKLASTVADKLENRYARYSTITDRDYTITRYKTSGDRYDFDVEGHTPTPIDLSRYELRDIEAMLQQAWNDAWGSPGAAAQTRAEAAGRENGTGQASQSRRVTIAPQKPPVKQEEPPFEEPTFEEEALRKMEYSDLVELISNEMNVSPPPSLNTSDQVVDWLMALQS